jgi:hypothetical protein
MMTMKLSAKIKRSVKLKALLNALPAALLAPALCMSSLSAAVAFSIAAVAIPYAEAQDSAASGFGPLDPTPPSGIATDAIIQKFAAQESEFARARDNYTFRQTVKIDTLDQDTGKVDGEYQQVTDITFSREGKREERVVFAPQNTLERMMLQQQDFEDLEHGFPFVLTAEDLPRFNIVYLGRQRVDEIDTYVFSAEPKVVSLKDRRFKGKIWVDQQELQIVLVDGKIVPDDLRRGHENLSPPFATYYEQVDGKYWFPTYTKAEANLHSPATQDSLSEDTHMRATVKYTDYKQFHATSRIIYNGQDITDNGASPAAGPDGAQPKSGAKPVPPPK